MENHLEIHFKLTPAVNFGSQSKAEFVTALPTEVRIGGEFSVVAASICFSV